MSKHDRDKVIATMLQRPPWQCQSHVVFWSRGRFIRRTFDGNKFSISLLS
ncbi:Uncharacterised protein [Mycobacteroides abscessus subsp. abscessus]|uniref:Uncharacterized protein n=1 Tax=Mycobacteroides abscessus subsp. abscessus TaxID=1185650 RepID=A0AB38D115_9MYCO|nr:Uncharacterised protein [Mycobacteroides abscessus subsp. abscessus]SHY18276.1 Uncharacterised protein [Mycobacteroides abscessus subsp. abscessus]SIA06919.1 Uncharacterised protein [Mycobacteroides abscessus subsp. abscessus]SIA17328.1 Uncharacterised protein [Mycobacteroides abscessus subsp. abscessus]SIB09910.1 Uncharacterised protein [Mycobacteroides abscessus subsp. abscessus]